MKEIEYIANHWPRDKQDEVYTVKRFLDNSKIIFELSPKNIDHEAGEPIDLFVKDINRKFQVVVGDFFHYQTMGETMPDERGVKMIAVTRSKADVIREVVVKPLLKKSKYGQSAKGITLLIKPPFDEPWVEKEMEIQRTLGFNKELSKFGFDEIYIVYSDRNILVYP